MTSIKNSYYQGGKIISVHTGIIRYLNNLPRLNYDPKLINFGIRSCDTTKLNGEKYGGRSSGCHPDIFQSFMGTIGETVERYCPAFYDTSQMLKSSCKNLLVNAIHPSEFALFHRKQYEFFHEKEFSMYPFDEDIEVYWDKCHDLTNNEEVHCPAAFIYLPWTIEDKWITAGTSTGLAAHTNWYKALLTALYEIIERDSFVLTWYQKIKAPKLIIDKEIRNYINELFPSNYEWHFFDITYDLKIPSVFGLCFGEAEYGKFIAVGSATRGTNGAALRKVIQEIGQGVGYFRYLLGKKKDWTPSDNFNELMNFEDHSIFYIKRPDLLHVFDDFRNANPRLKIDFNQAEPNNPKAQIKHILKIFKNHHYNVLVKDITTPDVNQAGFYCLRALAPQLLQMGGAYPFYFLGGRRLYEVPSKLGYESHPYEELNKFPHPFP
ncbi:MAG TPA: YcaO-like family protein [Balneolales bacterium]|nr:YcaO-like family protein [Balneolales bacterium]